MYYKCDPCKRLYQPVRKDDRMCTDCALEATLATNRLYAARAAAGLHRRRPRGFDGRTLVRKRP